jgi:hypothetical protein
MSPQIGSKDFPNAVEELRRFGQPSIFRLEYLKYYSGTDPRH